MQNQILECYNFGPL